MHSALLSLGLTPHGRLDLLPDAEAPPLESKLFERLTHSFGRGSGHGLLLLGANETSTPLPAALAFWRDFSTCFVSRLCARPEMDVAHVPALPEQPGAEELDWLALSAPPMMGGEYLTGEVLHRLWDELGSAFRVELAEDGCGLQEFLKRRNPAWNLVGRVHFNLAENRKDAETPFAFLATYTTRLSAQAQAQHVPLGQALREYSGAVNRDRLLSLLLPVQRAAAAAPWLRTMVDSGEIYHPLRWTPSEALRMLRDVPDLESAGVVVRMPAAWRGNRPAQPRVTVSVGGRQPSALGLDAMLDFQMEVTLDGEPLTRDEIGQLLSQSEGLSLVRGRWVEVDHERLARTLERFEQLERDARTNGISLGEAMRLLARADVSGGGEEEAVAGGWAEMHAGPWLAGMLKSLRSPGAAAPIGPGADLKGALRPYQQTGVEWLHLITQLGLGACLADDMGLGKTIQVLSLLLILKRQAGRSRKPSLLVAPASLIANWSSEIERFAPGLEALVAHPSAMGAAEFRNLPAKQLEGVDLVITTYGALLRAGWLKSTQWCLAVLDEAQAIKNPDAKQTRAVKSLRAACRIALTGTPVENRLGDLWSIFDFINPGLLGSAREFQAFAKRLAERPGGSYGPLRELVRPYILRRLKTDRSVIADLPEKTEMKAFCPLSRRQAALYQQAVKEMAQRLDESSGIQRKGLVLAFLMRFKQICNHPSQWLGDYAWDEAGSGKWARLREIAEVVAARQEKMLVFTQFREVTAPLAGFLASVFGRPGLVLHGEIPVGKRKDLVRRFQEDDSAGFFVLSLKAGGAGLNLTAASHVVHFDRWWNPAVENQATDRAFRIGQKRNVLVHKFVCRGTVEEKIDLLIESKRRLSEDLLEGGAEALLTEMRDEELLRLVALDLNVALEVA
jgi:non-specific serine/threonine protein kinase